MFFYYNNNQNHLYFDTGRIVQSDFYPLSTSPINCQQFMLSMIFMVYVQCPRTLEEGPRISGLRPEYNVGETVNANCSTSSKTKFRAILIWYMDENKVYFNIVRDQRRSVLFIYIYSYVYARITFLYKLVCTRKAYVGSKR